MPQARLVALDWGTSSLRAFLLGDGGACLEERVRPWGIMHLPEGGFEAALQDIAGDWLQGDGALPVLACGMVGSAQGWREAPYVTCPAGADSLVSGLTHVDAKGGVRLHIVPGVRNGRPDLMRGEETQVVGLLAAESPPPARLLLPGTHSKWVALGDGRIEDFRTYMTGELFALLRDHSILGRPARRAAAPQAADGEAFDRGVRAVIDQGSAVPLLFSTRALVLTGALAAEHSLDYLSGLLIGDELRCALADSAAAAAAPLTLIGDDALCARYRRALQLWSVASTLRSNTAAAGLWSIAQRADLVPTP